MWVKPMRGAVIMPERNLNQRMPAEGAEVPENSYYLRLLRVGDIARVSQATKVEQPKVSKPKADPEKM